MKKLCYIFIAFLVIIVGVEFRVSDEEIFKRLRVIIDKIEKRKELIL